MQLLRDADEDEDAEQIKTRRFEVAKLRILLADRCWSSCFLVSLGSNLVVLM